MSDTYRKSLTARDFKHLVRGGTLRIEFYVHRTGVSPGVKGAAGAVEIAFEDIGWDHMQRILSRVIETGSCLGVIRKAGE